jgi:hypothetical protein
MPRIGGRRPEGKIGFSRAYPHIGKFWKRDLLFPFCFCLQSHIECENRPAVTST